MLFSPLPASPSPRIFPLFSRRGGEGKRRESAAIQRPEGGASIDWRSSREAHRGIASAIYGQIRSWGIVGRTTASSCLLRSFVMLTLLLQLAGDFISLINRNAKRRRSIDVALDRMPAEARRFDEIREHLDSRGRSPRKLFPVMTRATEDDRLVDPDFARARPLVRGRLQAPGVERQASN